MVSLSLHISSNIPPTEIGTAKLAVVDPGLKAAIVTSDTNGECYAHVVDEDEKVRYSSMAQGSIKIALTVVLALVEQDLSGLVKEEEQEMEVEVSEEEEEDEVDCQMEVDYEMEVD